MWITDEFKNYITGCKMLNCDNISISDFDNIIYSVGRGVYEEVKIPISKGLLRILLQFTIESNPDFFVIENYKNIMSIQENQGNNSLDDDCVSRVVMPLFYKNKLCGSIIFSSYSESNVFSCLEMEELKVIRKMTEKFIKKNYADDVV